MRAMREWSRVTKALRGSIRPSIPFIIGFILLFSSLTIIVEASDPTTISITPTSQAVSVGRNLFVITVDCSPEQPVKAFKLIVSFEPAKSNPRTSTLMRGSHSKISEKIDTM